MEEKSIWGQKSGSQATVFAQWIQKVGGRLSRLCPISSAASESDL